MATMHTLLADLENKAVRKGVALQGGRTQASIISQAYKITYLYRNMKVTLSDRIPPRMQFTPTDSADMNGMYLGFQPCWTTVTKIDPLLFQPPWLIVFWGFGGKLFGEGNSKSQTSFN